MLVACAPLAGCDDDDGRASPPADCGLPSPSPGAKPELVPEELVPPGGEITSASRRRGGISSVINMPYGVEPAFEFYKEAVVKAGFKVIQLDNEGFEAEIYMRRARTLGAVQIRRSVCVDLSLAFVNMIKARPPK